MATDLERLVVQLSADVKGFNRELQKAVGISNRQARAIERRWQQAGARLDGIGKNMARNLIVPFAGVGAALSVREVGRFADSWTRAGNEIAAAGAVARRAGRDLQGINEIANKSRAGFEETARLYARLLRSTAGVAKSEEEVARATEIVNKAFKAGGAASSEMAAGILQLSQGLSSGMLQGDELRSVRENAPLLAKAIADYFKTTVGGLKELGSEGKLTSDKIFQAILSAQGEVERAFSKTASTIEEGVTRVRNAMVQYVGLSDRSYGASGMLVQALNALADNFDTAADAALKLAGILAAALLGRGIGRMIAVMPAAATAVAAFVTALRTGTLVAGGFMGALGPLGLVIGGVSAALYALSLRQDDAADGARIHKETLEKVEPVLRDVKSATDDAILSVAELGDEWITAAKKAVASAAAQLKAARTIAEADASVYIGSVEGGRGRTWTDRDTAAAGRLSDVADRDPRLANYINNLNKSVSDLNEANEAIAKIEKEMKDRNLKLPKIEVFSPEDKDGRKAAEKWASELARWNERIALIRATTDAQRGLNPLVDDYGYAVEKAKAQQELLNAAKRAGLTIDDSLTLQIEQLSEAYAAATVEAAKLTALQDNIRKQAQEMADFNKQLFRGIVDGFIEGKNAADVFADALQNIGNKLLDLAFDSLFSGGGSGGGLLGGLLSELFGGFRESGGPVQSGRAYVVGEKRPELFVPQQNGVIIPKIPKSISSGGGSVTYAPVIDARGASPEAVARLESILAQDKASFEARVVKTVNQASRNRMIQ